MEKKDDMIKILIEKLKIFSYELNKSIESDDSEGIRYFRHKIKDYLACGGDLGIISFAEANKLDDEYMDSWNRHLKIGKYRIEDQKEVEQIYDIET